MMPAFLSMYLGILVLILYNGRQSYCNALLPQFPASLQNDPEVQKFLDHTYDRIVGGRPAVACECNYQVSIQMLMSSGGARHFCGGTMINSRWVVTAGHCMSSKSVTPAKTRVYAGHKDLYNATGLTFDVKEIIRNPNYQSSTIDNDIALIYLAAPVPFDDCHLQPASLPENANDIPIPNTPVFVSGWGTTSEGGSLSKTLLVVEVEVYNDDTCNAAYEDEISPSMFCAGVMEGGKDSCQGDSGGPVVDSAGKLIGIVSWGYGCARPEYPGVYTRVCKFTDWIAKNIAARE